jgi:hypothetical protein
MKLKLKSKSLYLMMYKKSCNIIKEVKIIKFLKFIHPDK